MFRTFTKLSKTLLTVGFLCSAAYAMDNRDNPKAFFVPFYVSAPSGSSLTSTTQPAVPPVASLFASASNGSRSASTTSSAVNRATAPLSFDHSQAARPDYYQQARAILGQNCGPMLVYQYGMNLHQIEEHRKAKKQKELEAEEAKILGMQRTDTVSPDALYKLAQLYMKKLENKYGKGNVPHCEEVIFYQRLKEAAAQGSIQAIESIRGHRTKFETYGVTFTPQEEMSYLEKLIAAEKYYAIEALAELLWKGGPGLTSDKERAEERMQEAIANRDTLHRTIEEWRAEMEKKHPSH